MDLHRFLETVVKYPRANSLDPDYIAIEYGIWLVSA